MVGCLEYKEKDGYGGVSEALSGKSCGVNEGRCMGLGA